MWPLPELAARPTIIASTASGIELGYDDDVSQNRFVPVFAACDGVITFAARSTAGYTVSLDHAAGWSTHYGHLEHMFMLATDRFRSRRKERVRAGDVLGYSGRAPVRVTFEVWRAGDAGHTTADPAARLRNALVLPWSELRTPASNLAA
ncbi:MAG: M23 family metallopeptidase [Kofleriaceae bacterium]